MHNKFDHLLALASLYAYYAIFHIDWIHPALKIILALIVGIVGGFGGLLGKDLYSFLKQKILNKWK